MGREGLIHFRINFCDTEQEVISDRKYISIRKWGRLPRPKRDLETRTTYGPQTWQRGLSASVEHTLSKFCRDPWPVRRGLVAAVKCYVRKTHFFLCSQRTEMTHHYITTDGTAHGFLYDEGKSCMFSVSVRTLKGNPVCFQCSDPIIVGLTLLASSPGEGGQFSFYFSK